MENKDLVVVNICGIRRPYTGDEDCVRGAKCPCRIQGRYPDWYYCPLARVVKPASHRVGYYYDKIMTEVRKLAELTVQPGGRDGT